MGRGSTLTMTPADEIKYQSDLVRTKQYTPLGRISKISIAPAEGWTPDPNDPLMRKWGRLMDLRGQYLPLAQSLDRSMLLITAPLIRKDGRVGLPDLPDPDWHAQPYTAEELTNPARDVYVKGVKTRVGVERAPEKDTPTLVPQSIRARADARIDGAASILVFQPVVNIAFQPEIEKRLVGDAWTVECGFNPANQTHMVLLIDEATGECHFFGGIYDIAGAKGPAPGGPDF